MAEVTLYREEVEDEDLPLVCMRCGSRDADFVRRPFFHEPMYLPPLLRMILRKRMTSYIPLCPAHGGWKLWNGPGLWGFRPTRITADTITLAGVSDEFVLALRKYRARRRDEVESGTPPPKSRCRDSSQRQEGVSNRSSGIGWILAIVGAVALIPVICCVGFFSFSAWRLSRQPAVAPLSQGPQNPAPVTLAAELRLENVGVLAWSPDAAFPSGVPWSALLFTMRKEPLRVLTPAELEETLAKLKSTSPFAIADAAKRLAEVFPLPEQRQATARALTPMLSARQPTVRQAGIKALGVWGSAEDVPAIIGLLNDPFPEVRGTALDALASLKDQRGAVAAAQRLTSFPDRQKAAQALETMGPIAEKAVVPFLANPDAQVRLQACRVLKVIGTKESHAALQAAAKDGNAQVARAAKEAIKE